MQAHPLSNTAARITSTPSTTPFRTTLTAPPYVPVPSLADTVGLAHDAGNFLAALGLYCDLLSAPGVLRPEHKHYATELSLISRRSSSLIRRFLTCPAAPLTITKSSQPQSSDPPSTRSGSPGIGDAFPSDGVPGDSSHAAVLRALAPVLQRIASGAAKVSVTCPASLPPLAFPPEIIERITVNLVRNAAEAIRIKRSSSKAAVSPCGRIRVSLAVVGPDLQLTVENNGPGMPPAIAAAFLHPSPLPQGAYRGIGHRIIHQLAAVSAGKLAIRVLPGNGTIFSLKWPIHSIGLSGAPTMNDPTFQAHPTASEGSSNCKFPSYTRA